MWQVIPQTIGCLRTCAVEDLELEQKLRKGLVHLSCCPNILLDSPARLRVNPVHQRLLQQLHILLHPRFYFQEKKKTWDAQRRSQNFRKTTKIKAMLKQMVANETPNKSCKDCARGSHVPTSSSNCHQASLTEVSREFRTLFKHLHSFKVPHFGMFVKLNGILINKFGKGVKSSGKWKRERSGTEASFPMIGCSAGGHHIGGQNCSNHFVDVPVLFLFFFVFFIFLSYSGSFACFFLLFV